LTLVVEPELEPEQLVSHANRPGGCVMQIDDLPSEQAAVLRKKFVEGTAHSVIAEELGFRSALSNRARVSL
jgi:hypothetical protein